MINNNKSKVDVKKAVVDMVSSVSTMLKEKVKRAIKKTDVTYKQAAQNMQALRIRQNQLAQQNWIQNYTLTTAPALAVIVADALNAVLHSAISPLAVSCNFLYQTTANAFVWDVDVAVGTAISTSGMNPAILMRHVNNALKNINMTAIANFNAFFTNSWNINGASVNGQVARRSFFTKHWLELWQISLTNLALNPGVMKLTLVLQETQYVQYFANRI